LLDSVAVSAVRAGEFAVFHPICTRDPLPSASHFATSVGPGVSSVKPAGRIDSRDKIIVQGGKRYCDLVLINQNVLCMAHLNIYE
jgi:hypothetical protein